MNKPLCIYHGGCDDGFGAAMAVHYALLGNVELFPGAYGKSPPLDLARGRDVYVVDFSYKQGPMLELASVAQSVVVLDHHKSALHEIGPLIESGGITGEFDMSRSGAMMAWQHFHDDASVPALIHYIQDRDLWLKKLPNCDEVIFALRSYPQTIEVWDELLNRDISELVREGAPIKRYYRTLVDAAKARARKCWVPMGEDDAMPAAIVNADYTLASEVAGELHTELADDVDVGVCFYLKGNGQWGFSWRSQGTGNARRAAEHFGGGGHDSAAGCGLDYLPAWALVSEKLE